MSGGHFNYNQFHIEGIVGELESLLKLNPEEKRMLWYDFSEETFNEMRTAITYLKIAQVYVNRLDYLISGDDGEDTFHSRLKEELSQVSPLFV